MLCFCDSSAIVKRYVTEIGSAFVIGLTDPLAGNKVYIVSITQVEVASAIIRRQRRGEIMPADAAQAIAAFRADLPSIYHSTDVSPGHIEDAMALVERHGLRAYDAM